VTSRRRTHGAVVAALVALAVSAGLAQSSATAVKTLHVHENVWMLVTPDANLALQVGDEGALLVDTGRAGTSEAVLAAIRSITTKPLRYIINTSAGPNQIGNNVEFGMLRGGATDHQGRGPIPAIVGMKPSSRT